MAQTKLISRILYGICLVLSIGYLATAVYSVFCLVTGFAITPYGEDHFLHINYPFTGKPFLNVDNDYGYIVFSFLLILAGYGIFFLLSARVFRVFFQSRLFTRENIQQLKVFYTYNIFFPLPLAVTASFFVEVEAMIWGLVFTHFMLGIFCLFLANIFAQGVNLQNEQDLFI